MVRPCHSYSRQTLQLASIPPMLITWLLACLQIKPDGVHRGLVGGQPQHGRLEATCASSKCLSSSYQAPLLLGLSDLI
jgi:hypothetical protein